MDAEGCGTGLFEILSQNCLEELRKTAKNLSQTADVQAQMCTWDLQM
jgi:hypothetical protein